MRLQIILVCVLGLFVVFSSATPSCCPSPKWIRLKVKAEEIGEPPVVQTVDPKKYCISNFGVVGVEDKHRNQFVEFEMEKDYKVLRFKFVRKSGELKMTGGSTYFGADPILPGNKHSLGMVVFDAATLIAFAPNTPLTIQEAPLFQIYSYPDYRFTQYLQSYELPILPVGYALSKGEKIRVTHAQVNSALPPVLEDGTDNVLEANDLCFDMYMLAFERGYDD